MMIILGNIDDFTVNIHWQVILISYPYQSGKDIESIIPMFLSMYPYHQ